MSLLENAKLLQDIFSAAESLELRGQIRVSELGIDVRSEASNVSQWLPADFGAAGEGELSNSVPVKATMISSDLWVEKLCAIIDSGDFEPEKIQEPGKMIVRVDVTQTVALDYLPMSGVVWLTNHQDKQAIMVYSSRTPMAEVEFRAGLSNVIFQHMCANGWKLLRASAVRLEDRTHLMLDAGDGTKTGALISLVRNGATLISADNAYVRLANNSLEIQSCPSPILVSMGWAVKYGSLAQYIARPDRLGLPQTKFDPSRVWKTPKENVGSLPDQLLLRMPEFTSALKPDAEHGTSASHSCGLVDSLLLTELNNNQSPLTVKAPPEMAMAALTQNLLGTNPRPSSLQLGFDHTTVEKEEIERFVKSASGIPAFGLTLNTTTKEEPNYFELVGNLAAAN